MVPERPGGTAVSNRSFTGSDGFFGPSNPVLSLPAGAYTLTVAGSGQATGAYSFRLPDLAAGATVTPGTAVSGTLSPANSTDIYRFTASAGDSYYFARLSSNTQRRGLAADRPLRQRPVQKHAAAATGAG